MGRNWQPLIPRSKVGLYGSESEKIYPKIKDYLHGVIYDIGCGNHKITPDAIGIDGRDLDGVDIVQDGLNMIGKGEHLVADVVFSSHVLEHCLDDYKTIMDWYGMLKNGGLLILYLPDDNFYDSYENQEHIRNYRHDDFVMFFERAFCGKSKTFEGKNNPKYFEIIEHGLDVGDDKYSFFLVAKKHYL